MFERVRPVRLAAFIGVAGLVGGRRGGDEQQVLLALVAFLPCCSCSRVAMPDARADHRVSLVGDDRSASYWIGLASRTRSLLRGLDHGGALVFMVLLGTFIGDTGAYLGGRAFGTRQLAPRDLAQQDRRGAGDAGSSSARSSVWYAQPHLRRDWITGTDGAAARA